WFCALENAAGIGASLPVRLGQACSVTHQTADFRIAAPAMDGRDHMACREMSQLDTSVGEKGAATNEQRVWPMARKRRKGGIDFCDTAGVEHPDLQSHAGCRRFHVAQIGGGNCRFGRIDQYSDPLGEGHKHPEELKPFGGQFGRKEVDPCGVAARLSETCDKAKLYWVFGNNEYDGDRCGRLRRSQ